MLCCKLDVIKFKFGHPFSFLCSRKLLNCELVRKFYAESVIIAVYSIRIEEPSATVEQRERVNPHFSPLLQHYSARVDLTMNLIHLIIKETPPGLA